MSTNYKVIVVAGPTASGKTAYALELAERSKHLIINADSMQVYKDLVIGNNKGNLVQAGEIYLGMSSYYLEGSDVPAWLFDITTPDQLFSVSEYQSLARKMIAKAHAEGLTPIIVGGSGLYIRAVVYDYHLETTSGHEYQKKISMGSDVNDLQMRLSARGFDLNSLNSSDINNPRRLQNLLLRIEDGYRSGEGQFHQPDDIKALYEIEWHVLQPDMVDLRQKIAKRASLMLKQGLMEEVQGIITKYGLEKISPQVKTASGYRQVFAYLAGDLPLSELEERIRISHYQYAKKQMTWNKKYFPSN